MKNDDVIQEFAPYNGFYKRPDARQIIFEVFRGQCAATEKEISMSEADIGHIVPQSESAYFEEMFPGLDVHNILNLHLLSQNANRRVSNHFPKSPLAVYNAISYNMRLMRARLPKIEHGAKRALAFDAQSFLDSARVALDVDFSDHYRQGKCFGTFHAIPTTELNQTCNKALENRGHNPQDFESSAQPDIRDTCLKWTIHRGKLTSVSSTHARGEPDFFTNPELEDFAQKLFYLRGRVMSPPPEISNIDGDYLAASGPLANAPKTFKIKFKNISKQRYFTLVETLAIFQKWEKEGRISNNGRLIFIRDSEINDALNPIFNTAYRTAVIYSNILKGMDIPNKCIVDHGKFGYGDGDLINEKMPRGFTATIIRTSDWAKFMKEFEKRVVKAVSKLESVQTVQKPEYQPMPL